MKIICYENIARVLNRTGTGTGTGTGTAIGKIKKKKIRFWYVMSVCLTSMIVRRETLKAAIAAL